MSILASDFFLINSSAANNPTLVFPKPVLATIVAEPPALSHRFIQSFCRSVLSIKIDLIVLLVVQLRQ
jgi:hypothetical protein